MQIFTSGFVVILTFLCYKHCFVLEVAYKIMLIHNIANTVPFCLFCNCANTARKYWWWVL